MMVNDFFVPTESQAERDESLIKHVRETLVMPLLEEIGQRIPSYMEMSELERFKALMRINSEYAYMGPSLPLRLGWAADFGTMKSAVFSNKNELYLYKDIGGAVVYEPLIVDSEAGNDELYSNAAYLLDYEAADENSFVNTVYKTLPIPFKIALVALYVRQHVITTYEESCRFAAGWSDAPRFARIMYKSIGAAAEQRFGWHVFFRDAMPQNAMGEEVARVLRQRAAVDTKSFPGWIDEGGQLIPLFDGYDPTAKQKRDSRESTKLLKDFFTRILPSRGYYVGRSGVGTRLMIDDAYKQFDTLHPGLYTSKESFANAYYRARKEWGVK